ncbi:chymotrypsin-1-like [Cimex lectularius]|uniref:trypsin n=1 Tax=Cimex lectularius TaxID=79782 RepID=A0A8I6TGP5_CIMLE|nr:chymotrypsin-1-like [Cimex lectularius]
MHRRFSQIFFILSCLFHINVGGSVNTTLKNERKPPDKEGSIMRISSGVEVKIETVPYVVRLKSSDTSLCTGAIIHDSWVLTAAHCIVDPRYPEDVTIYAGIDDTSKEQEAQKRIGKNVVIHKDYWAERVAKYDFALVKVEPFKLDDKVKVLELSDDTWPQNESMYERKCLAAGWGADDIGRSGVNKLRALNVTARHGQKGCKCFRSFHNRRLVCLDSRGKGICKGDSGGALVCENKGVGVAHIIYSKESCNPYAFGNIKLTCRDTTGAYMYICPALDWISQYVPSVPKSPKSCRASSTMSINILLILVSIIFVNFETIKDQLLSVL